LKGLRSFRDSLNGLSIKKLENPPDNNEKKQFNSRRETHFFSANDSKKIIGRVKKSPSIAPEGGDIV
jgi:hypothetical protein